MNMMKNVLQMEQVSKLTEMERNKNKTGDIDIKNKNIINNEIKNKKDENEILSEDKKEEKEEKEDKKEEKKDKNQIIIDN